MRITQLFRKKKTKNEEKNYLVRTFEADDIIISEGDKTKEMFIIQEGQVAIEKIHQGGHLRLKVLEKGQFFGEMSLMEGLPRSATARALTKTHLLVLSSGNFLIKLRRDPTFAFEIINQLCYRIRATDEHLLQLITEAKISPQIAQELLSQGDLES
jgi:CRP-like cAMP-binding protein